MINLRTRALVLSITFLATLAGTVSAQEATDAPSINCPSSAGVEYTILAKMSTLGLSVLKMDQPIVGMSCRINMRTGEFFTDDEVYVILPTNYRSLQLIPAPFDTVEEARDFISMLATTGNAFQDGKN